MREWDQVKEIVASALERSPDERPDFLREACGQDDELRAEVESLLSNYDGADSLLEESPVAKVFSFPAKVMVGRQIGSYRILGETGQGGMAVVYLAERADQEYRKRVAIKMVKPGVNHEEIIRRFRNERQTLAALDHPHIVKLLDGGTTEEGWPYLVMDFVEGIPIDQYCDSRRLPIRERLELFQTVCQVVHYAHEHMVIHRDLKPSNILIASDGVPRLLDFGIAKLLNPEYFQIPLVTTGDWRPMTPQYASPEQVRGDAVTKATDIYSLGVLLYELLTGHRPHSVGRHSRLEIERLVCEEEPERPSTVVSTIEEDNSRNGKTGTAITPELVSKNRGLEPAELGYQLRGDLDIIIIKALRKEPERRFSSAEEFSEDIERHLTGRPVRARKPTLSYRSGRFLGRHKEALVTAMAVLALMAGLVGWEAHRIRKQNLAEQQSGRAQVHARPSLAILGFKNLSNRPDTAWISTALSEMLTTELAAGEELRTIPGDTVARAKIDLSLPDEESISPETLKRLRENLGSNFVVLGSYFDPGKEKGGQVRLDLRLQDTAKGETIATVSEMGPESRLLDVVSRTGTRLRERFGLSEVSQLESQEIKASVASNSEAMRVYSQGLERLRAFDALSARDLLTRAVVADPSFPLAHSALAKAWQTLGYDAAAAQESKQALDLADKLSREDHLRVEARYYESNWNWQKAIETYGVLFRIFPDNLEYGLSLANTQTSGGKGKDALSTLAALVRQNAQAKKDPGIDLAQSLAAASVGDNNLRRDAAEHAAEKGEQQGAKLLVAQARAQECRALANLGENERANTACEEARRIYAALGDRGGLARCLHTMAEIPLNQGDLVSAQKLYRQALSILLEIGDKRASGSELTNLGLISAKQGDFVTAQELYDESLRSYREAGDKNGIAVTMGNSGTLLRQEGRLSEAVVHFQNTLTLSNELGHRGSAALSFDAIGQVLAEKGDLAGAYKMFQQAVAIQQEIGERNNYASSLTFMGDVRRQQDQLDEAQKLFQEALSIQDQLGENGDAAETRLALAQLACDSERPADAERLARTALEVFQAQKQPDQQIYAEGLLSRSLLQQGKTGEANESIAKALKLSDKSPDVFSQLSLTLDHAYVLAATKNTLAAETAAGQVLAHSRKLGILPLQLEASLALGEIQMKGKNPAASRARLEELEKTARAKGFELIARKAAAARKGGIARSPAMLSRPSTTTRAQKTRDPNLRCSLFFTLVVTFFLFL